MAEPYLITFTPINRFYFGTSRSFSEGFYTQSSLFPTQTTILGAIRKTILRQHNLLDDRGLYPKKVNGEIIKEVYELTGTSLMRELDEEIEELGALRKLSPVFIVEHFEGTETPKDFFFPSPSNIITEKDERYYRTMHIKACSGVLRNNCNRKTDISYLIDEDVKAKLPEFLAGRDFWNEYLTGKEKFIGNFRNHNEVFIEDSQPGIGRLEEGNKPTRMTEDKKYYFKKDYRMHPPFSFGVIVYLEGENNLCDDDVFMGGERSMFKMKLKKIGIENRSLFKDHPVVEKLFTESNENNIVYEEGMGLCIISPLCASEEIGGIDFSIVKGLYSPRTTSVTTIKSDSYSMYPAGSILYPNKDYKGWATYNTLSKIGYNCTVKFKRGF